MPMVKITMEAYRALRSTAIHEWRETGYATDDGMWAAPLQDETLERLESERHPGETISDTIVRIVATTQVDGQGRRRAVKPN